MCFAVLAYKTQRPQGPERIKNMENATKNTPVSKQAVGLVVLKPLGTTNSGRVAISGLFRNADGTVQNFDAYDSVATRLSHFRVGSQLIVSGFSVAKSVAKKDGSGNRDVLDIVVYGFSVNKAAQQAYRDANKATA